MSSIFRSKLTYSWGPFVSFTTMFQVIRNRAISATGCHDGISVPLDGWPSLRPDRSSTGTGMLWTMGARKPTAFFMELSHNGAFRFVEPGSRLEEEGIAEPFQNPTTPMGGWSYHS